MVTMKIPQVIHLTWSVLVASFDVVSYPDYTTVLPLVSSSLALSPLSVVQLARY